jgi:uncharacterized protein
VTRLAHGLIDADGHVFESDREIFEYLPPPYRGATALFSSPFFPTLDGFHRQALRVLDGKGRLENIPTGQDWVDFIEQASITLSVIFPTGGLSFGLIRDADWAAALAQAYNDWLYDRVLRLSPHRLKGMALIPLQDPGRAVQELRRAVHDMGMVGAILPAVGLHEAFGHRSFWPVYEAAQELGVLLAVHGAPGQGLGLERLHRLIEVRTLTHPFSQMVQMTSMMFEGVFDAFPDLRFAFCEAGCGWLPYIVERLDLEYSHRSSQAPGLHVRPSDHLRNRRIFVHAELEELSLPSVIEAFGEGLLFCASDFPHEPRAEFLEGMETFLSRSDVPDSAKQRMLWDNPIGMYGLDEPRLIDLARTVNAAL